jgi:hypothetical protein
MGASCIGEHKEAADADDHWRRISIEIDNTELGTQ